MLLIFYVKSFSNVSLLFDSIIAFLSQNTFKNILKLQKFYINLFYLKQKKRKKKNTTYIAYICSRNKIFYSVLLIEVNIVC